MRSGVRTVTRFARPMARWSIQASTAARARSSPRSSAAKASAAVAVPAKRGERAGADVGLETAGVPAPAARRFRPQVDDLVADLARRAVDAQHETPVEHDAPADARAERDADQRRAAAAGAHARLCEREGPRIVDQPDRHAESFRQRLAQRVALPRPREIREEADGAVRVLVDARHADPRRRHRAGGLGGRAPGQGEPVDHVLGPAFALGRQAAVGNRTAVAVEDDPLDVGAAEIESEVRGHSGASYGWR